MDFKGWLKAGTLSAMLGFGAAAVNAQEPGETPKEGTEVTQPEAQQEIDYSKIKVDSVQISINGEAIDPRMQQFLLQQIVPRDTIIDDGQDVHDINTKIHEMAESNDRALSRVMQRLRIELNDDTTLSVQGFDGEKKVVDFDADDVKETTVEEPEPEEAPKQRSRGRTRAGNNSGESMDLV